MNGLSKENADMSGPRCGTGSVRSRPVGATSWALFSMKQNRGPLLDEES